MSNNLIDVAGVIAGKAGLRMRVGARQFKQSLKCCKSTWGQR